MRKIKIVSFISFAVIVAMIFSCSSVGKKTKQIALNIPEVKDAQVVMMKTLESGELYINSDAAPFLASNDEVFAGKSKFLLLDIRSKEDYVKGHVDGALLITPDTMIVWLGKNDAANFQKIVVIDNIGFRSAYIASLLRAAGFGNAFAMKEGMASWASEFTKYWTDNLKNTYVKDLKTDTLKPGEKGKLPELKITAKNPAQIMIERAEAEIKFDPIITADQLMKNKDDYYIVNYWPMDKYAEGHLPGSFVYPPKKSFSSKQLLLSLPTNKKIAVYCFTGQTSSAAVGYLRFLGYDAYSLAFGANGFMFDRAKEKEYHPYIAAEKVRNYPMVKGEKPSDKAAVVVAEAKAGSAPVASSSAPVKKKKSGGGGGCE